MSEYEKQAQEWLQKTGTELTIEYVEDVEGFPFNNNDKMMHRAYKCTLKRTGAYIRLRHNSYEFPFYGSAADWENGEDPTEYDVLACLEYADPGTIDDFVAEYGYEVHDWSDVRRIEATYNAVKEQSRALSRMYSELELDALSEIR